MRYAGLAAAVVTAAAVGVTATDARAQAASSAASSSSFFAAPVLSLQDVPESVYAPPAPEPENSGTNEGGVRLALEVRYLTDYIFRGIERFEVDGPEDSANLQIDSKLAFDFGKLPSPFVGLFANVASSDDVSSLQEIRPTVGFDWNLRPLLISAGHTSYIFPNREDVSDEETAEVFARLELDDSYFFRTDEPILSPYVFGAYDYDLYNGWYLEAGVYHDFEVEDTGLTVRVEASVAYVHGIDLFLADGADADDDSGFQHYQLGLIGRYDLNHLLNVSTRYGQWSIIGYLHYTDGIDSDLRADTQIWGGAGIGFRY